MAPPALPVCTPAPSAVLSHGHVLHTPSHCMRTVRSCTALHTRACSRTPCTLLPTQHSCTALPAPACSCTPLRSHPALHSPHCRVHPASLCSLHVFLHVPFAPTQPHMLCTPLHAVAHCRTLHLALHTPCTLHRALHCTPVHAPHSLARAVHSPSPAHHCTLRAVPQPCTLHTAACCCTLLHARCSPSPAHHCTLLQAPRGLAHPVLPTQPRALCTPLCAPRGLSVLYLCRPPPRDAAGSPALRWAPWGAHRSPPPPWPPRAWHRWRSPLGRCWALLDGIAVNGTEAQHPGPAVGARGHSVRPCWAASPHCVPTERGAAPRVSPCHAWHSVSPHSPTPVSRCVPVPSVPRCPTYPFVSPCTPCPCSPPRPVPLMSPHPLHPHISPTPPLCSCPCAPRSPCVPPHVPVPHARPTSAPPPTQTPPAWAPHQPCQHPGLFWERGGGSRALGGARPGVTLGWRLPPPPTAPSPAAPFGGTGAPLGAAPTPHWVPSPWRWVPSLPMRACRGGVEAQTPTAAYWLRPLMSLPCEPKGHFVFDCK